MWSAFRVLIALTCVAAAGCRSTSEREEELRQLEDSSSTFRAAAADAELRGSPERSAAYEQTANELDASRARQEEQNKRDEEFEKEHPIYSSVMNAFFGFTSELFLDVIWSAIFGEGHDDDDDDWDDMPGCENQATEMGAFKFD